MAELGRSVGLDVGDVRIGVAATDPLGILAQPREVITRSTLDQDLAAVKRIVEECEAVRLVVGLPLNQKGEVGPQAEKVLAFIDQVRTVLDIEIVTQDERFSTAAAERGLIEANVSRKGRKKVVDKIAAHHILQTWMDRQANLRARNGE
ncbi:MAG: Holliday junction resolvase RuvX [bacterium]|nr:Holliday junction resolvase RuvX [bacterium]